MNVPCTQTVPEAAAAFASDSLSSDKCSASCASSVSAAPPACVLTMLRLLSSCSSEAAATGAAGALVTDRREMLWRLGLRLPLWLRRRDRLGRRAECALRPRVPAPVSGDADLHVLDICVRGFDPGRVS